LEEAVAYYKKQGAPSDQSALVSLLREVQQENGGAIPKSALPALTEGLGVKESYLLAVIRRIPSLRLSDMHTLELCGGPNCGKHAALAAAAEKLCKGKNVTLKFVPCMRLCGKGPNLKWDGTLYHKADEALIKRLLEEK
jgi:NADH:ubiquinone oxidoreductase subunit E